MRILLAILFCVVPAIALAQPQCRSEDPPNCAIYTACFEANCHCAGTDSPYTATFGPKYCTAFSTDANFSPAGKAWRDRTLRCLTDRASTAFVGQNGSCNCGSLQDSMVGSHTSCYTAQPHSFCELGAADVREIAHIVSVGDLWDLRNGTLETAKTFVECVKQKGTAPSIAIVKAFAQQMITDSARDSARALLQATAAQADSLAATSPAALKKALTDFANQVRAFEQEQFPVVHP